MPTPWGWRERLTLVKHLEQCLVPSKLYITTSAPIIFIIKMYASEMVWTPYRVFGSLAKEESQSSEAVRRIGFCFSSRTFLPWESCWDQSPTFQRTVQRSLNCHRVTADPTTPTVETLMTDFEASMRLVFIFNIHSQDLKKNAQVWECCKHLALRGLNPGSG